MQNWNCLRANINCFLLYTNDKPYWQNHSQSKGKQHKLKKSKKNRSKRFIQKMELIHLCGWIYIQIKCKFSYWILKHGFDSEMVWSICTYFMKLKETNKKKTTNIWMDLLLCGKVTETEFFECISSFVLSYIIAHVQCEKWLWL